MIEGRKLHAACKAGIALTLSPSVLAGCGIHSMMHDAMPFALEGLCHVMDTMQMVSCAAARTCTACPSLQHSRPGSAGALEIAWPTCSVGFLIQLLCGLLTEGNAH